MKRVLKWAVGLLAVVVLLVLVAIVAVRIFVSSDQMKRLAESQGEELLGRKVGLQTLSIGLFRVEAEGLTVAGRGEEGREAGAPLLRVRKASAILNPVALLYRRISIVRLSLDGVALHAAQDAQGRFDFQDVIDRLGASPPAGKALAPRTGFPRFASLLVPAAEAAAGGEGTPAGGGESGFDFIVHDLDVSNLSVSFRSAAVGGKGGLAVSCSVGRLKVDKIEAGDPLDISVEGRCSKPAPIRLRASAYVDLRRRTYRASARFEPFDLAPFAGWIPPAGGVALREGRLGGRLGGAFSGGREVRWEADLQASALSGEYLAPPRNRRLRLEKVSVEGRGVLDLKENSLRVERLSVALPFAKGRLTQPSKWNLAGQDEVHLAVDVSDAGALAGWAGGLLGFPLEGIRHSGAMKVSLSAFRDRRKGDAFILETSADFDPLDLAPLARLVPAPGTVRALEGRVGGRAKVSYSSERVGRWDLDLRAEGLGAQIRPGPRGGWRKLGLARAALRTAGSFDARAGSAEVARLEVELPYARARVLERARWNVSGRDEARVEVDVTDLAGAVAQIGQATGFRLAGIPAGTKLRLTAGASRSRKAPGDFALDAAASFDPIEVGPFVGLVSLPEGVRGIRGTAGGRLELAYAGRGAVRWKADLRGRNLSGEVRPAPGEPWGRLRLERAGVRSEGWFDLERGAGEMAALAVELPFAQAKLRKKAVWNVSGRDAIDLAVSITDLSAAEAWGGTVVNLPIRPGKGGETLEASFSIARERRRGEAFSYRLAARFDPLGVGPLARFASLPPTLRRPAGEVAGRVDVTYTAAKLLRWEADLRSEGLALDVRPGPAGNWKRLKLGRMHLVSKGSYDPLLGAADLSRLDVALPFGKVNLSKRTTWNHSGRDAIHLVWSISNLADAAAVLGPLAGGPIARLAPEGTLKGSLALARNRRASKAFQGTGSVVAELRRLHHADYPNLEVRGSLRARLDGRNALLSVPRLLLVNRKKPDAEPAVLLRDLSASLAERELMDGRILVRDILAKYVGVRITVDPEYNNNLDVLFEEQKPSGGREPAPPAAKPASPAAKPAPKRSAEKGRTEARKGAPAPAPKAAPRPAPAKALPDVKVARFEIPSLDVQFVHVVKKGRPPVRIALKNLQVRLSDFDTRMRRGRLDTRLLVTGRGRPNPLFIQARMNPALSPPDMEGVFSLQGFDLRAISPYARDVSGKGISALLIRGTEITSGTLDIDSSYRVRNSDLRMDSRAKVTRFNFRPTREDPLSGLPRRIAQSVALSLLKQSDNTISLRFPVRGRLDDPSFHPINALVEALFVSLFDKLLSAGGDVGKLVRGLIGGAVEGITGGPGPQPPAPEPGVQPAPPASGPRSLEQEIERRLRKGLRDLLRR